MKVKLTKLFSSHNYLRTNEIVGECSDLPLVGCYFTMYAEPLEFTFGVRQIETSAVKELTKPEENVILFKTQNSEYKLEVLGE